MKIAQHIFSNRKAHLEWVVGSIICKSPVSGTLTKEYSHPSKSETAENFYF